MTQTPDITPEAVERYDFFGYERGDWVRASDYDTLAARLAEVEAALAATVQREADTTARYDAKLSQCEARLLEVEEDADMWKHRALHINEVAGVQIGRAEVAEAALPAVYRLAWEDAYQEHPFNAPTPTAAELMARIQTGKKDD